jgi:probable F420-dependent oxidoreductase
LSRDPERAIQVYAAIDDVGMPLAAVPAHARRAEALGFDGLLVPEAVNDGMLVALLALEHTERLRVATGVVVAFARSPMLVAQDAWALQRLSGGRFELGLGPQVRGNVVHRFGMPWSAPAPRMRDYVGALRAIFECWQHGGELRYESESYRLDRMQPYFRPGPQDAPRIPIALGAVGPRMTRVAGEVADAVITHPTHSDPAYLREVVLPRLAEGARGAGRAAGTVSVVANPMTATGGTAAAVAAERQQAREVLTFTFSTPAYRGALDHHGFGALGDRLHALSRSGEWSAMAALVGDDLLDLLVPTGSFEEIPDVLLRRYDGLADALTLRMPRDPSDDGRFAKVVAALRGGRPAGAER